MTEQSPDRDRPMAPLTTVRGIKSLTSLLEVIRNDFLNGAFVKPEIQKVFEADGFHLSTTHYYSPIVTLAQAEEVYSSKRSYEAACRHHLNERQWELMSRLLDYRHELEGLPRDDDGTGFYWNNPMFPPLDALAYYGLICDLKPSRIIEIGSGFSTMLALKAARHSTSTRITCIEPYPSALLRSVAHDITLVPEPVEKVGYDLYKQLAPGDILFVDTTHTVKIGSDVNMIVLDILPLVPAGVWIHFHDIFLPFEYPASWIKEIGIQWNEQYLIAALLASSSIYEAKLMNYWISETYRDKLGILCSSLPIRDLTNNLGGARGASLWLYKTQVHPLTSGE